MFLTLFHLVTAVVLAQSALECRQCVSTVNWDDCLQNSTNVNCTHYCFIREEKYSSSKTIHFRQGCTDDGNFCAGHNPESDTFCSICSENTTLCVSESQRMMKIAARGMNDTDSGKSSQTNSSTIVNISTKLATSFKAMKQESQVWLRNLANKVLGDPATNDEGAENVTSDAKLKPQETTTDPTGAESSTDTTSNTSTTTTENVSTMATTVPPGSAKPDAVSGSYASVNGWVSVMIVALNYIIAWI